jgi:hypothetical protein
MAYYHENNKHIEQRKNIEGCKREKQTTNKGKLIKTNSRLLNINLKGKKGME